MPSIDYKETVSINRLGLLLFLVDRLLSRCDNNTLTCVLSFSIVALKVGTRTPKEVVRVLPEMKLYWKAKTIVYHQIFIFQKRNN